MVDPPRVVMCELATSEGEDAKYFSFFFRLLTSELVAFFLTFFLFSTFSHCPPSPTLALRSIGSIIPFVFEEFGTGGWCSRTLNRFAVGETEVDDDDDDNGDDDEGSLTTGIGIGIGEDVALDCLRRFMVAIMDCGPGLVLT